VKLGLEDRKKAKWAAGLGALAVLALAFEFIPMFFGGSSTPDSREQAASPSITAPRPADRRSSRSGSKSGKKTPATENLDPTLKLQLLIASEQTMYEGSGRNIFVSQAEAPVVIQKPNANGTTDHVVPTYTLPPVPQAPPIPLKFFGFASRVGEAKKVFLSQGEDVFVAGEGEIVDRRYKIIRISPNSVEMQDVVVSGPTQTIPLSTG
jgi:hypothetical protein